MFLDNLDLLFLMNYDDLFLGFVDNCVMNNTHVLVFDLIDLMMFNRINCIEVCLCEEMGII